MIIVGMVRSSKVGYQADVRAASIWAIVREGYIAGSGPVGIGMGIVRKADD